MNGERDKHEDRLLARQQVLAAFGTFALASDDLDSILNEACVLVERALGTQFSKVVEVMPGGDQLIVRAGVGWRPGIVGHQLVPNYRRLPEGYALEAGQNIVSPDREAEQRFEYPEFMIEHGVHAFADVIIPGAERGTPYGLLQADSQRPRAFTDDDLAFMQTYANLIGAAVARIRRTAELQVALADKERLFAELQHRVKNNLAVIGSFVHFQTRRAQSAEARNELSAVAERIEAIRLVHDRIYARGSTGNLDAADYLSELCDGLLRLHGGATADGIRMHTDLANVVMSASTAVPLGLLVNEFVTNSLKYAFGDAGGVIRVELAPVDDKRLRLSLCDNGRGLLPATGPTSESTGTGMRIIEGLARQVGGRAQWKSDGGTSLTVEFPAARIAR